MYITLHSRKPLEPVTHSVKPIFNYRNVRRFSWGFMRAYVDQPQ
jgi:hypothetical protein